MSKPAFIPGLKLSEQFFTQVVQPILDGHFTGLKYSAGLIGGGSDVLGFDTPRSTDHMWGPRMLLFVPEKELRLVAMDIYVCLQQYLPHRFNGFSVHFGAPDAVGCRLPDTTDDEGLVNHLIEIHSPELFLLKNLKIESEKDLKLVDWLDFQQQSLLEVSSGKIFHDGLRRMNRIQKTFSYYPRDIWLHHLAHAWQAMTDEEAFPGRCDELGDDLGWQILATRQVERLMDLCFLMERRYAPYSKWFGTAFSKLKASRQLTPVFKAVLSARSWKSCEPHLVKAYEFVARKHNRLGITKPLPAKASPFYGRPYQVIWGDRFAEATQKAIRNREIRERTRVHRH